MQALLVRIHVRQGNPCRIHAYAPEIHAESMRTRRAIHAESMRTSMRTSMRNPRAVHAESMRTSMLTSKPTFHARIHASSAADRPTFLRDGPIQIILTGEETILSPTCFRTSIPVHAAARSPEQLARNQKILRVAFKFAETSLLTKQA